MRKTLKTAAAFAATLALVALPNFSASAASNSWTDPTVVAQAQQVAGNVFALADGSTLASVQVTIAGHSVVEMMLKAKGSKAWSPATVVSPLDSQSSGAVFSGDAKGNLVAAWYDTTSPYTIKASVKKVGQSWTTPIVIGEGTDYSAGNLHMVTDSKGNTTVVWLGYFYTTNVLQTAELPAGGTWRPTEALSCNGRDFGNIQDVVAPDGTITIAYQRTDGSDYRVEAMTRKFGQAWSTPTVLSAAGSPAYEPQLTSDPFSNVTVVWHRTIDWWARTQVATKSAAGVWSAVTDISRDNEYMVEHKIVSDPQGNLTIVYSAVADNLSYHLVIATKPFGGSWSTPTDFSPVHVDAGTISLSSASNGALLVVWLSNDNGTSAINYSTKEAGQDWVATKTVSTTSEQFRWLNVVGQPDGSATAIWVQQPHMTPNPPPPAMTLKLASFERFYDVSYSLNSGTGTSPTAGSYSTSATNQKIAPAVGISNPGFDFVGWNTKADGSGASFKPGQPFTPTGDATLYAIWTPSLANTGATNPFAIIGLIALVAGFVLTRVSARNKP